MELEEKIDEWEINRITAARNDVKPTLNIISFDEKKTIVLMGDTHIGSKYYDTELHKENIKWCLDSKSPVILMGDNIEAATRDSVGAGVYEQQEIIDKQIDHFMSLYKPLSEAGLILGMHDGNHEGRVFKSTGVNIGKIMAQQLNVKYFGWAKMHYVRIGKQHYTMYTCHGASGARLPTSKIKASFNMQDIIEAEVYAMGHVHLLGHQTRNYFKIDPRNKKIVEAEKHFILTGSYLSFWNSYAHMMNLEPMRKGSVKIKFHEDKHLIRVSM